MEISSKDLSLNEKLKILADAAKYDVACTSSGSSRRGKKGMLGNTEAAGICHSFSSDGRCVSLLKILLSNECIYDCKYCLNRVSNDRVRTTFTPDEICTLVVEFYRRVIFKLWNRKESDLYDGINVSSDLSASYKVPF